MVECWVYDTGYMETNIQELARLRQADVEHTLLSTRAYLARHRHAVTRALEAAGFADVKFTRVAPKTPQRPEVLAQKGERPCCICFAPMVDHPMGLESLSEEQCAYCDAQHAECDVYYACLLLDADECLLALIGPTAVKLYGTWQLHDADGCQFLPLAMRRDMDRFSSIYGGAALLKVDMWLMPQAMEYGTLPRFSVQNLFTEAEQGESAFYALMSTAPPSHFMLMHGEVKTADPQFVRPFFYGESNPVAELELTRCLDAQPEVGMLELMDRTGLIFYAECLEAVLYPARLQSGRHYMCTLSLVASGVRRPQGEEPMLYQEPYDSFAQVIGTVADISETTVDGYPAAIWTIAPLPQNPEVVVQVYVGKPLARARRCEDVAVGDVVEVEGFLYVSPDAMLETAESWQDSGEVAAMLESRQHATHSRQAHRGHARFSLAHAVVASAFAGAGYVDLALRADQTRRDATFAVRNEKGYMALLFMDVQVDDFTPQFAYTNKHINAALERVREVVKDTLHAHRCIVRLKRHGDAFATTLRIEPPCPGLPEVIESEEKILPPEDGDTTEAAVCRMLALGVCHHQWGGFAAHAHEDMSYTSLVNGTKTHGKLEYMRYMAERKPLWEEEQVWPGIEVDTGTIEYVGVRRPCFMITCYGHMVGASVATLRDGKVSDIVTLPQEANETFVKDADSTAKPLVFHPLRGHLTAFAEQPSPLQRFTTAYLQDCMIRKTGFSGATGSLETVYISDGVEHPLDKKGARWVKLLRHNPSFCDLAFTCAGRTYAVCAVEVEKHPLNGGDINAIIAALGAEKESALSMAEQHRLIPCVFPVQRDHSPSPAQTWNLWNIATAEPVTPTMSTGDEDAPVSEWEVLQAALAEASHMLRVGGCEIISCHDTPSLLPHLWFRDPHGQLCWLIIRPHTNRNYADRAPSDAELLAKQLTPGTSGYVIEAEPFRDYAYEKPATTRDSFRFVKITMPVPIEE